MLPAYAGMILGDYGVDGAGESAPRVCGDDPAIKWTLDTTAMCSPRMRG